MSRFNQRLLHLQQHIRRVFAVAMGYPQKMGATCRVDEDIRLMLTSGYFTQAWYAEHYPDVVQSEIDLALHYLLYGEFEGRDPGKSFSSMLYLQTHPNLIITRANPLVHYLRQRQSAKNAKTPLYLHVGLHKTGTSAIQKFLRQNSALLQEKGFYYHLDIQEGDAHHTIPAILRQKATLKNIYQAEAWLADCKRYCQAHNLSLLLSSKAFSEPIQYEELAHLLQPFDTSIILYIRRQDFLIESVINQVLKGRQEIHPDNAWINFDRVYVTDFTKRISQWRQICPNGRIILRRYGATAQKRYLEADFLDAVGIHTTPLPDLQPKLVNQSFTLYEFVVLRKLVQNGVIPSRAALEQARIKLSERITRHQVEDGPMVGNYFSAETRQNIVDMYADSNEKIRAEFFPEDATLFEPITNTTSVKIDSNIVSTLELDMMQELSGYLIK